MQLSPRPFSSETQTPELPYRKRIWICYCFRGRTDIGLTHTQKNLQDSQSFCHDKESSIAWRNFHPDPSVLKLKHPNYRTENEFRSAIISADELRSN